MKCNDIQALLPAYLDGEESDREAEIEKHLSHCVECRQELNEIKETRHAINQTLQGLAAGVHTPSHSWDKLQARLALEEASSTPQSQRWQTWSAPSWSHLKTLINKGAYPMQKIGFAALSVITLLAVAFVVMTHHVTTVSAQQILEKAAAVQAEADNTQGIWHVRISSYQNPHAHEGGAGYTTISDSYYNYLDGYYRSTTEDTAGNILNVSGADSQYDYYTLQSGDTPLQPPIQVQRVRSERIISTDGNSDESQAAVGKLKFDPAANEKAIYEQFNSNPRVKLDGKITRDDGREAFVLIGDNYQTFKRGDGKEEHVLIGSMKMVFDAETYRFLESELKVRIDEEDVILSSVEYLVSEILPAGSEITWDLSDLPGVEYIDEEPDAQPITNSGSASRQELSEYGSFYAIPELPEGYTEEIFINITRNEGKQDTFGYEINYDSQNGEHTNLMWIGNDVDDDFVDSNFYDGSFKTARGLVLHYSISSSDTDTSAILTTPENISYLVYSSLSREELQNLIEIMTLTP